MKKLDVICEGEPKDESKSSTTNNKQLVPVEEVDEQWVYYRGENFSANEAKFLSRFDREFPPITDVVRRDEIGGLDKILDQIETFKTGINHRSLYHIFGSRPPRGFILQGPPGVGKTMIAKYIATDLGATFVDLPLSKFESKWVGQAASNLMEILDKGRKYHQLTRRPVMYFFDEAEEALKDRSLGGWHGPRVNVLLREMDGLGNNEGLLFGGATNHLDKIDPAILRPGRMDYVITIPEYTSLMMADVFRATATRLNRLAPHHEPFKADKKDFERLGRLAKDKKLRPADVGEIYRRAVDVKVSWVTSLPGNTPVTGEDSFILPSAIEQQINVYDREGKGSVGRVGF